MDSTPGMDNLEDFGLGVHRYWLDDEQIAVIKTEGQMTNPAIDRWAEVAIETMQTFPGPGPIYICYDLTGRFQGFNDYAREAADRVYATMPPDRTVYAVMTLPSTFLFRIVSLISRRRKNRAPNIYELITVDQDQSLAWLRQMRDQHEAGTGTTGRWRWF